MMRSRIPMMFCLCLAACGGGDFDEGGERDEGGEPDDNDSDHTEWTSGVPAKGTITFYRAAGGADGHLMPLVGSQVDDGSVFIGAFARDCTLEAAAPVNYPYTNSQNELLDESKAYSGPKSWGGGCGFEVEFTFQDKAIVAVSGDRDTFDNGLLDIELEQVSEAEFYQGLKAETADKGLDYRFESNHERYDTICKQLSGVERCEDKF